MKPVVSCLFALAYFLASAIFAQAHELPADLATVGAFAPSDLPFVRETVVERLDLLKEPGQGHDLMTGITYFAARNGVGKISAIRVMTDQGSAETNDYFAGLRLAATRAPIVLSPLGGKDTDKVCELVAQFPATAFLFVAGGDASQDPAEMPCFASNIMFVTGLNLMRTDLASFSNFGGKIRLAVPAVQLRFPVSEGKTEVFSSRSLGLAMAAGKMNLMLKEYPYLRGGALIQRFLDGLPQLPSLQGKVIGARALLDTEE